MTPTRQIPVAIVGAGPAGIAAAIQCQRQGLQPLVFEGGRIGGLLNNAYLVENYPGFPNGISGRALITKFRQQLDRHAIDVQNVTVEGLEFIDDHFQIHSDTDRWQSDYLILASGTRPLKSELPLPPELAGQVHFEIAGLLEKQDRDFCIVGAGDAAFDYALNLGQHNRITILNRSWSTRCLPLLEQRAAENPAITCLSETSIKSLKQSPDGRIELHLNQGGRTVKLNTDYLVFAIGREPNFDCLSGELAANPDQFIAVQKLFPVGDLVNGRYRQTAIAVSDGVRAAMQIANRMKDNPQ